MPWLKRAIAVRQPGATEALPAELKGAGWTDIIRDPRLHLPGLDHVKAALCRKGIRRGPPDVQGEALGEVLAWALRRALASSRPCTTWNRY